eukprot:1493968-Rhodomonas_salina.1
MASSHDHLLPALMKEEWQRLPVKGRWGSMRPKEIQLDLLLAEDPGAIETPVANLLYLLALNGMSMYWGLLPGQYRSALDKEDTLPPPPPSLLTHIFDHAVKMVRLVQTGQRLPKLNRALAEGIQTLVARGTTLRDLEHPAGGWWVDLPRVQQEEMLMALEASFVGSARHRIQFDRAYTAPPAKDSLADIADVGDDGDELTILERPKKKTKARKARPIQFETGLAAMLESIITYDTEKGYLRRFRTGLVPNFDQLEQVDIINRLVGLSGFLLHQDTLATRQWRTNQDGIPKRGEVGWWV